MLIPSFVMNWSLLAPHVAYALIPPPEWLPAFLQGLLKGESRFIRLLHSEAPFLRPTAVRVQLYQYEYETNPASKAWWSRRLLGTIYGPVVKEP